MILSYMNNFMSYELEYFACSTCCFDYILKTHLMDGCS